MDKKKLLDKIISNYQYFSALYNTKSLLSSIKEQQKRVDTQISQTQKNIKNYNELKRTLDNQSISPNQIKIESTSSNSDYSGSDFSGCLGGGCVGVILAFVVTVIYSMIFSSVMDGKNAVSWGGTILFFAVIIASIYLGIKFDMNEDKKAENKIKDEQKAKAEKVNQEFKQQSINIQKEIKSANEDLEILLRNKKYYKDTLLPQTENKLKQLEIDKPTLINLPIQYKGDPNFLVALYDVIDTDQAASVGDGIKIVQDRFLNKDLAKSIANQIKQSQVALQQTINDKAQAITSSVDGLNNTFLQKANEINKNVMETNKRITNVGQNMTADLNSLNASVVGCGVAATKALEDVKLSNQQLSNQVANLRLISYNS